MMVPPDVNFVNAIISSSDSADRPHLNTHVFLIVTATANDDL